MTHPREEEVFTSRVGECDLPLRDTPYGVLTPSGGECYLLLGRECLPLGVGSAYLYWWV